MSIVRLLSLMSFFGAQWVLAGLNMSLASAQEWRSFWLNQYKREGCGRYEVGRLNLKEAKEFVQEVRTFSPEEADEAWELVLENWKVAHWRWHEGCDGGEWNQENVYEYEGKVPRPWPNWVSRS